MSGKRKRAHPLPRPFYDLSEIKELIDKGQVLVRENALDGARQAFGWGPSDVLDAIRKLQPKHFHKSDGLRTCPGVVVDYYKARGLRGENVYTHFYVDDNIGKLIVNSFKEI